MTDVQYSVDWYLGSKYKGSILSDWWPEIEEFRNEKIAQYGALFHMEIVSRRYME